MSSFAIVIWVVGGAGIVIAIVTVAINRSTWDEYGKRAMTMEREGARGPAAGSADADRERDEEIRQLLNARNELRRKRGGATVDIDQELARLKRPEIDPALREEIREHVIARNHRRQRAGKPPLDVETEIERQIEELSEL